MLFRNRVVGEALKGTSEELVNLQNLLRNVVDLDSYEALDELFLYECDYPEKEESPVKKLESPSKESKPEEKLEDKVQEIKEKVKSEEDNQIEEQKCTEKNGSDKEDS